MDAGGVPLSVTVMPKLKLPAAVGVPVKSPFVSDKPAGRVAPLASEKVSVPVPPVAANCSLYTVPICPGGSGEVVVKASVLTTIFNACELDAPVASVTFTVKLEFPAVVAFPVIFTVSVLLDANDSPAGKLPEAIVHFRGGTPPVAVTGALYG